MQYTANICNKLHAFHHRCVQSILGLSWRDYLIKEELIGRVGLQHVDSETGIHWTCAKDIRELTSKEVGRLGVLESCSRDVSRPYFESIGLDLCLERLIHPGIQRTPLLHVHSLATLRCRLELHTVTEVPLLGQ